MLPGASERTCAVRSVLLVIGAPLKEVTTSPFFSPALSAPPPELTLAISAPTTELDELVAVVTEAPRRP